MHQICRRADFVIDMAGPLVGKEVMDMEMIFFKACPKCRGDLHLDRDPYGVYVECLQCGFTRDLTDEQVRDLLERKRPVFAEKEQMAA